MFRHSRTRTSLFMLVMYHLMRDSVGRGSKITRRMVKYTMFKGLSVIPSLCRVSTAVPKQGCPDAVTAAESSFHLAQVRNGSHNCHPHTSSCPRGSRHQKFTPMASHLLPKGIFPKLCRRELSFPRKAPVLRLNFSVARQLYGQPLHGS